MMTTTVAPAGVLTATPPFDFAQSLAFTGTFPLTRDGQPYGSVSMTAAAFVAGRAVAFEVAATGSVHDPRVEYRLFGDADIDESTHAAAADRIGFWLSLNDDLRPFYAIAREDPAFAPVLARLYGYHQVKFLTPFENACWAILSQRTLMSVARGRRQLLAERFGSAVRVHGRRLLVFPDAARVAVAGRSELAAITGNERKAAQLSAIAREFAEMDEQFLRTGPFDEVASWLQSLPGIGPWSASFILVRGLGRTDRVPLAEPNVIEAASRLYNR
ncbi:MAG: DNA-3-methyladenine glycosylase 2 family protein, partial [Chloroflexi bacterium]|nr:DNA-3-methyladenine glycosylase 2 family protein [Chloroflexota bacterium]